MSVVVAILELIKELAGIVADATSGTITADEARTKAQAAAHLMVTRTGGHGTWDEDLKRREQG